MRKKALTFQLISWIFLLTATAGFMNAVAIILFSVTNSHHTGNLTNSMILLLQGDFRRLLRLLLLLFAFLGGTILSGYLFPEQVFKLKRRYGYIQIGSGIAIAIGNAVITNTWWYMLGTTFILGLQNGMFVYYKGIIVRTTHMSGNLTDAGLAIGRSLAGRTSELWKARFQLANLGCFLFGALAGATLLLKTDVNIWHVASALYLFLGFVYFLLYHHANYVLTKNNHLKLNEEHLFDFLNQ